MIVLGYGTYHYTQQVQTATPAATTQTTMVGVTAVKNDLLALANAERHYWATNAKYASLEEIGRAHV